MFKERAKELQKDWDTNPRWKGIKRPYSAEDVIRLRGSIDIEYTFADMGSKKLWELVNEEDYVNSLGALTGNQAVQQVKAGLKAIYLVVGKLQQMQTWQEKCIQIKVYTQ